MNENNHFHETDLGHVTETNHRIGLNRNVSFKSMFITLALLFRLVDFIFITVVVRLLNRIFYYSVNAL